MGGGYFEALNGPHTTNLSICWSIYNPIRDQYIQSASVDYPYISYVAAKISMFRKNTDEALKFITYALKAEPNNNLFSSMYQEIAKLIPNQPMILPTPVIKTTPPPPTLQDEINRLKKDLDEVRQKLVTTQTELKNKNGEINNLNFTLNNGTAKLRIYNQLNYKIGKAIIQNKTSPLGYIKLPFILSYIYNEHKKDQLAYQDKIKKNPKLTLPKLQDYPDYKEALKIKDSLEYKLGEEFIKASKNWYKGGFVKFIFNSKKLK